jgi:hypothetical protein
MREQRGEPLHPPVHGDVIDLDSRSASISSMSQYDSPQRRYQRTATVITLGQEQEPRPLTEGQVARSRRTPVGF